MFAPATPPPASFRTYGVIRPDGRLLEIEFDRDPTSDDLERIFAQMQPGRRLPDPPQGLTGGLGKITQTAPAWGELEPVWSSPTWSNQQIAKAKAMMRWRTKPKDFDSYAWEEGFARAAQPWQVEERGRFFGRRISYAAGATVGGFLLTFGALALLLWSWRFVLARIRELSNAFRGK